MGEPRIIRIRQERESTVQAVQRAEFGYRYAYARSAETQSANDLGQDYIVICEDGDRLAFVLCDGVGQSFYGDIAARFLGEALLDWLWKTAHTNIKTDAERELAEYLNNIRELIAAEVQAYPIPSNLSPMVRDVLEQKRSLGSESIFVAGLFNLADGLLILSWMGDSRLRLWSDNGEITRELGDTFHTTERWSTRQGPVGKPHAAVIPLINLRYLIAYSDGLARLDKSMTHHLRDASIDAIIEEVSTFPESDDISIVEVWMGNHRPSEYLRLLAPQEVQSEIQGDFLRVEWSRVPEAKYYVIEIQNGRAYTVQAPSTFVEIPLSQLSEQSRWLRIRAWDGEEPSDWSKPVDLPGILPRPIPESPPERLPIADSRPTPRLDSKSVSDRRHLVWGAGISFVLMFVGLTIAVFLAIPIIHNYFVGSAGGPVPSSPFLIPSPGAIIANTTRATPSPDSALVQTQASPIESSPPPGWAEYCVFNPLGAKVRDEPATDRNTWNGVFLAKDTCSLFIDQQSYADGYHWLQIAPGQTYAGKWIAVEGILAVPTSSPAEPFNQPPGATMYPTTAVTETPGVLPGDTPTP